LEADKGEEGGWIGGVGEEVMGDDDLENVIHFNLTHVAQHFLITHFDTALLKRDRWPINRRICASSRRAP
jgi:hypothetical protein